MVTKVRYINDGVVNADQMTITTALPGDNSVFPATTAFVRQEISALVDSSPSTLDTLNELAAALGDDPNFATTITNSIGLKAPLASPTFTGTVVFNSTGSIKVPVGTTAERDVIPTSGMFRYNSSETQFEGYQDGSWGAIGGAVSGGGSNTFTTDSFIGDGSTTDYVLSQIVSSEDNLLVFIEGVFQQQDAYSIATVSEVTTLTFTVAPVDTRDIIIYSVAGAVSGSNLNIDTMIGDNSTTDFILSIAPINENNTQVFLGGVYQNKSTYSISGTTLTFSTAPPTGMEVEVMTFTQTNINVPVDNTITTAKLVDGSVTSAKLDTNIAIAGTLDVGGVGTFSGSVGIGAVSPARTLEITSADTVAQRWSNTGVNNYVEMGTTGGSVRFGTTGGAFTLLTGGDAAYAGEAVALNIDANGSLDIGLQSTAITGLRGARRLVLNGDGTEGVDFLAYASTNGIVDGQYIGGYLLGNDDNNGTEDHFAGMWANAEGTGGSMTLRFAAGRDNYENDTPQMMIDGVGNFLVGKTASAIGTAGTEIYGTGVITSTRAGNILDLNRLSTDGNIAQFRADGAVVGSIGTGSGDLNINGPAGHSGIRFQASSILPRYNGSDTDGTMDLGYDDGTDTHRWRNLYLSGGVYLGGTSAANHLDEYEEGAWTPILVGSTGSSGVTYTTQRGSYVRVGNVMTAEFEMKVLSKGTASGAASIGGLPANVSNIECAGRPAYYSNLTLVTGGSISLRWFQGNALQLRQLSSTVAATVNISELDSNFDIRGSITAIVV